MKPILLYDIDGTLLHVKKDFLYELISELLGRLGVTKAKEATRSFAGRTDRGIFAELIGDHPAAESVFNEFKSLYIHTMNQALTPSNIIRFDEAIESVRIAKKMGFQVGLCTGNFREVAYKKAAVAGLDNIFEFGGFGCHHIDRNHLPGAAHKEYQVLYGESPAPDRYVIIGDTPNDIRCAKFFGARAAAVCTGSFSKSELEYHRPDWVLPDLGKSTHWLKEL